MKNLLYHADHRHATWLELFFDLVFVAVIGVITHDLAHTHDGHLSPDQFLKFPLAFIPVWWIWATHTFFANRFDNYHVLQRVFSLVVMAMVIVLSTFVKDILGKGFVGFVLSYVAIRMVLSLAYLVVYQKMQAEAAFAKHIAATIAVGAITSGCSILIDGDMKYVVFLGGIVVEMIAQAMLKNKISVLPIHKNHLVERIGLLSIIILGETVISLVGSLSKVEFAQQDIIASVVGFLMLGALWWIYFGALHLLEHAKKVRTGIVVMYCHLPFSMGLIIMANLVGHSIVEDLDRPTFALLATTGLSLFYLGKQIPYMVAFPPLRVGIVVNSVICIGITAASTLLPSLEYAIMGMTGGMLLYVFLYNFVVFPRTDLSAYLESHEPNPSFTNKANLS